MLLSHASDTLFSVTTEKYHVIKRTALKEILISERELY